MLHIWTSADAQQIKRTFGSSLLGFKPDIPKHKFVGYDPEDEFELPPTQPGDMLLIAGMKPYMALQAHGLIPKNRTLTNQRGKVFHISNGGNFMLTFDPGIVSSEPHKKEVLDWDLRLAVRYMTTKSLMPPIGKYVWVNSFQDVIDYVDAQHALTGKAVDVSTDLETAGLYPWYEDKDIVSISFTCKSGESKLLYTGPQPAPVKLDPSIPLFDQIHWLLTSPKVKLRLANGKFDLIWIAEKWGIECTNFKFDTLLVGSLLDENRSNSLNGHAKVFSNIGGYDDPFNDKYDKGKMDEITNLNDLAIYAGGDTDACYQSADVLRDQLCSDEPLTRFYTTIVHPAVRAFEKLERRGVLIDQQKFAILRDDLSQVIKDAEKQALELLPNKMKCKYIDRIDKQLQEGKNPLLPSILKDYFFTPYGLNLKPKMFTPKDNLPSTAKAHLKMFSDVPEAVAMVKVLTTMDTANKARSTFVDGFLNHLRPDGRFHPTYMLFHGGFNDDEDDESGTVSGRLAAKDPAFQCLIGSTSVLAKDGERTIVDLVEQYEKGERTYVLTHTGKWRKLVGVYRNGVQPVFKVTLSSKRFVICTENHPLLTHQGFKRTDDLTKTMKVFTVGSYDENTWARSTRREANPDVPVLGRHEDAVLEPQFDSLGVLREAGHQCLLGLGEVRRVSERHGGSASRDDSGEERPGRELRAGQLLLASEREAERQQTKQQGVDLQRGNAACRGLGAEVRLRRSAATQAEKRLVYGEGSDDAIAAYEAEFDLEDIVSIEPWGEQETFDLTIDRCHSFIANGIVVHNTLPKKTIWAKRLRECYIAPPGKVILALDYSQGELRVVACIAPEPTMIAAYMQGLDLHAVTGAQIADIDLALFLSYKDHEDASLKKIFDDARDRAKPANFGLLYGMSAEGFVRYAWAAYGRKFTLQEAEVIRAAFFTLYPGLLKYHERMRSIAKAREEVRSPLGRIRHLPHIKAWDKSVRSKAERQAINSPVQATLTDMMIYAIALIEDAYPNGEFEIFGVVHDQVLAYVDADKVDLRTVQAKAIMENLPFDVFGWKPQLKFVADAEAGLDLAHLIKVKLAA